MLISISIALNAIGLLMFAHTQRSLRRRQQRAELTAMRRAFLRAGASLLLGAGWFCAARGLGSQLGSLLWIAELGLAGLMVAVILALREPAAKPVRVKAHARLGSL